MEAYGFPYPPPFPVMRPGEGQFQDHGDGFGDYYAMGPMGSMESQGKRHSNRSKHRSRRNRSLSQSRNKSRSRSRSRSRTRSLSRSRSRSRSRSNRSQSRTRSGSRSRRDLNLKLKEPSFLDAFRVLYLIPSKHKKNTAKYLVTKKRQDRVQEYLKSDGLGSKRWLFYPRDQKTNEAGIEAGPSESRDTCDQRVKVDGEFFRKYKRSKKVDNDAPIKKLKRWELLFYKKLGFIQAV